MIESVISRKYKSTQNGKSDQPSDNSEENQDIENENERLNLDECKNVQDLCETPIGL